MTTEPDSLLLLRQQVKTSFHRWLASEMAPHGITVSAVSDEMADHLIATGARRLLRETQRQ